MATIDVQIDSHLRLDGQALGHDLVDEIMDELILINPKRAEAKQRQQYKWEEIPESFFLCELDGDELVMARGYALQLKLLLREHGIKVKWHDNTVWRSGSPYGKSKFKYRSHQPEAVRQIKRHRQGVYKAPTGSGKTVAVCGVLWELHPQNSLILVDKINLVDQWIDRIEEHVGIPRDQIGRIGEGEWTEGRITVATIQTLYKKRHEKRTKRLLDKQSITVLDECHHATAETYCEFITDIKSRIRIGVSATPSKTGVFEIILNTLGEVFYETTLDELRSAGLLVVPVVRVVYSDLRLDYWGDHKADSDGDCDIPACRSSVPFHRHKNNYAAVKKALISDPARNALIAEQISEYAGRHTLVISDETTHLDYMMAAYDLDEQPVYRLTGKDKAKKREQVQADFARTGGVLFSTIAGEALDIKEIDTVILPFPTKNEDKVNQNVGRGTRMLEGKEAYVIDIADSNIAPFAKQFMNRRWKAYEPLGFEVELEDD